MLTSAYHLWETFRLIQNGAAAAVSEANAQLHSTEATLYELEAVTAKHHQSRDAAKEEAKQLRDDNEAAEFKLLHST